MLERAAAAGVIPDARRHRAARAGDAPHLAKPGDGVGHEVDDELGDRRIERVVGEGEGLGGRLAHVDARVPGARRLDERRGRIDRGDGLGAEPGDELRRQRPRAAPDVQDALARLHSPEIGHLWGEQDGVPAHEPVVGIGGDIERHAAIVRRASPGLRVREGGRATLGR